MVLFQWFGHKPRQPRLRQSCLVHGNACVLSLCSLVPLSVTVKTLGVTLDRKLTFRPHITNLCKFCFYHIRAIRHIRSALTKDTCISQTIACSLVSSRTDYANSLFVGVSDLEIKRLQRVQNSLAPVVLCCESQNEHSHQSYYISCIGFLLNSE